jgi:hypothetical protein
MQGLSLAPELLVQCDEKNNGCGGGRLDDAWGFLKRHGIPKDGGFMEDLTGKSHGELLRTW